LIVDFSRTGGFAADSDLSRGPEECDEKQRTEQHINSTKYQVRRMQPLLQIKHE
jgi:ferritin-like metal-binding protein YciE